MLRCARVARAGFPHPLTLLTACIFAAAICSYILPAGEYEVEANHPKLKTSVAKVTVKDGDSAKLDLPFKG